MINFVTPINFPLICRSGIPLASLDYYSLIGTIPAGK